MTITRRHIMTGFGAAGIAAALPRLARADIAALEEAARKEASVTWYIAQVDTETAEAMGRAFTAKYPGVTVAAIRTTGQVAYERLMQELKNNAPQCDVFSGTDIAQYPELKKRNQLANYTPAGAATLLPAFHPVEDPGYWYPAASNTHLLVHHAQKVTAAEAPRNWPDLLDPKWKGRVATGHPAFSGCTGIWALALRKQYGWEFFEKLAKNNPRIGRSGNDPVTLINAGECLVGPAPANTAFQQVDKGNPIAPVYPIDGATLCVGPSAVMARAPHPNAARLFMEWLMSDDFAKLSVANHGDPVHPGLTLTSGQQPLDQVAVMALSVDEIAKGVPEVIEQWRDTFGS
ncbi:MAG: extracellular solute-binding protein [Acetobacteraceae bacterium]|jgi:iron(III) transport system substrate-binding protein